MRLILLICAILVCAACVAPAPRTIPTATSAPIKFPPTWTPTPFQGTRGPTAPPPPTRTPAPIATPAASIVFTSTDQALRLEIPANWITTSGQRQLISDQTRQLAYASFSSPGLAPQPAALIFYKWPNAGPIDNDTAWQQAYAVASLAVKVCPVTLTTGGDITVAGERAKFIGYVDSCGVQGELIGLVHDGLNYGILLEAPQADWTEWQPRLRQIISTLVLSP